MEDKNNLTSRMLMIFSFLVSSLYLMSEPIFTLIYALNTKEFDKENHPVFISQFGSEICSTILIVFAITFIAKNNTGILTTVIDGIKSIQSRSNTILKTITKGKK
jgi:hypothetical protein